MSTNGVRLTIRLSSDLYDRLQIFALGRSNGHMPKLSNIMREALEHYITPPESQTRQKRLTDKVSKEKGDAHG
jgi:predicted transcriptional regulator